MEASAQRNADQLIAQAQKKLTSFSVGWLGINPQSSKWEEARDLYDKAAAQLKIAKNWKQAGQCYLKCAEFSLSLKSEHDAVNAYTNAGKALRNVSIEDACQAYWKAIELQANSNKFSSAAKNCQEIAEMQESLANTAQAIEAYQKCADFYKAEDQPTHGSKALSKVGHLKSLAGDYAAGVAIFEQLARDAIDSGKDALKYGIKDYYYKASLIGLALGASTNTMEKTLDKIEQYYELNPPFAETREGKLVKTLAEAFIKGKLEDFNTAFMKHDQIFRLDDWQSAMLLVAQKALSNPSAPPPAIQKDDPLALDLMGGGASAGAPSASAAASAASSSSSAAAPASHNLDLC